ncbi:MAG: hypothetical protein AAFQ68_01695 [Bacteroidota bacterium]
MESLNFTEVAALAPLIPLIISFFRYHSFDTKHYVLIVLILFGGFTEILASILEEVYSNNLPLYHFYVWFEFTFIATVFHQSYSGLISRKQLLSLIIFFSAAAILNILFFQDIWSFASHTRTLESLMVLVFAIRYFYLALQDLRVKRIERTFSFWFSTAVLIYFSANLLLFIYSNMIMVEDHSTFMQIWAMHGFLNILLYSFYAVALWQKE